MKKSTQASSPFKIVCTLFGHKYLLSKKVTPHVKEYTCKCCKHQLTTNGNGKLTELTPKHQEINDILGDFYSRRLMHMKNQNPISASY